MKKSLLVIVFLLFALLSSLFLVFRTTVFIGRASAPSSSSASLQNSYLFASPLTSKADSKSKIRITVFLLDGQGLGVPNQLVELRPNPSYQILPVQTTTDDAGRAVFDLTSSSVGQFPVSAQVKSQALPQSIKITFY